MHSGYQTPILKQLRDQQVRFAPRAKKLEQIERAERLLNEIDPQRTYSYEYLCYRITDYRPDAALKATLTGEEARHDVRLFVEDVSDAANVTVDDLAEPVHTVEQLSRMFNVSTKTIARWREQGLVSRRFIFDSGRKRVGFLQSSVDRFVASNHERVQRGKRFSQLTSLERDEIIERARRLARAGASQSEAARRVAKQLGRGAETIRYTLKQHDQQYPQQAIFPGNSGPLTEETKRRIYQEHRRGVGVSVLSRRYERTRTTIYQVLSEVRATRLLDLPLEHITNEQFDNPELENEIMAEMPEVARSQRQPRAPSGLPSYLATLYEVPLLTREQEYHLFRKYNFLKHKAQQLREELDPTHATNAQMDRIEQLYEQAVATKNQIVQSNLRLVVSIAKRHVNQSEDFFSLVSDGNISLIRAVEKFDFARGNKFSTYATWAIMRNFARTIPGEYKHRERFRTSQDEAFAGRQDDSINPLAQQTAQQLREQQIERILARLDEREQRIIASRFGLDHNQEPKTLKEVGSQLGVTKERIRQIEARALLKLRQAAAEEKIELPD